MRLRPLKSLILCSTLLTWSDGSEIQELISGDEVAEAVVISINEEDCSKLFSDIPDPLLTEQRAELCGVIFPLQVFVPDYIGIVNCFFKFVDKLTEGPNWIQFVPLLKDDDLLHSMYFGQKGEVHVTDYSQRSCHWTRASSKPVRDDGHSTVCEINIVTAVSVGLHRFRIVERAVVTIQRRYFCPWLSQCPALHVDMSSRRVYTDFSTLILLHDVCIPPATFVTRVKSSGTRISTSVCHRTRTSDTLEFDATRALQNRQESNCMN